MGEVTIFWIMFWALFLSAALITIIQHRIYWRKGKPWNTAEKYKVPVVGEVWSLDDGDPWFEETRGVVKVIAVKGKYVKINRGAGIIDSKVVSSFGGYYNVYK